MGVGAGGRHLSMLVYTSTPDTDRRIKFRQHSQRDYFQVHEAHHALRDGVARCSIPKRSHIKMHKGDDAQRARGREERRLAHFRSVITNLLCLLTPISN